MEAGGGRGEQVEGGEAWRQVPFPGRGPVPGLLTETLGHSFRDLSLSLMRPAGESSWHPVSSGIPDCYHNVTHLPIGVTVRFRVACANRAGQGPFSNPSEKVFIRGMQGEWSGGQQRRKGTLNPWSTSSEHHGFALRAAMIMIFLFST